jgi:asparagine synthase (glutamine-hydrolysing)
VLLFASEIKAILAYPGFPRRLNSRAISSYLDFRYTVGTETFFADVSALAPGHTLIFDRDGLRIRPYWEPPHEPELHDPGAAQAIRSTFDRLQAAVQQRMISDVPVGAYLSGGLDSSIIVALMAEQTDHPVQTFTIGFPDDGYNEFGYARQVANLHRTDHKEIVQSEDDYFDLLPQLVELGDAPLGVPNEVPLWQMSVELKKDVTVVLSGEGADASSDPPTTMSASCAA